MCVLCVLLMQFCADSCEAQAWSAGCVLEVLYDLEQMTSKFQPGSSVIVA